MSDFDYSPPAPTASKGRRKWPWVTGAVVSGLLVIGVVDPTGSRDTAAQEAAVAAASATMTSTSKAAIATTSPVAPSSAATTPESMLAPVPVALAVENADGANAALSMLATVPIKGRAPKTGYDREMFGQAWTDDVTVEGGHNGCDTRNDILRRDLTAITVKPGSNGCAVQTGTLADTYTATTISFVRGTDTSSAVQIDHMVALSNAWQTGAQQLDPATLKSLANDPRNLQAVDGPANQQKSDGDAATWLPSNTAYRCTYVARQVEVKAAYGLWVT
ncbi:deoxyribonuclease, partial [Rhodococcus sp. 1168]